MASPLPDPNAGAISSYVQGSGANATITLSWTNSNDVIVVDFTDGNAGNVGTVSSPNLTWTRHTTTGSAQTIERWYAIATIPLTSEVITISGLSGAFSRGTGVAITGADTSNPWNAGGPVLSPGGPDPLSITPTVNNTMVLAYFTCNTPTSPGAGFTTITAGAGDFSLEEYQPLPVAGVLSVTIGSGGTGTASGGIVDAINPAPAAGVAWWDNQGPQPPAAARTAARSAAFAGPVLVAQPTSQLFPFRDVGFIVQDPQPPSKPNRRASAMFATGPSFVAQPPAQLIFKDAGFLVQPPQPPSPTPNRRAAAIMPRDDGNEARFANWFNFGWTPSLLDPKHPRSERSGVMAIGDVGTEAVFVPPAAIPFAESVLAPLRRVSSKAAGLFFVGDAGLSQLNIWYNFGWEVAPPQLTPSPKVSQRGAAASGESLFASFDLGTWHEVQAWAPPRVVRRVSFLGDDGTQAAFAPPVVTISWGYEPTNPAKRTYFKGGMFTERDVETPLVAFLPAGWQVQALQPNHPRPERSGVMARGDDGTEAPRVNFFPTGWEVQAPQPPHPRPERAGSIMAGDPGIEGTFTFVAVPIIWPYDAAPALPPHPRRERAGAIALGESGTESPYAAWLPSGWQPPEAPGRARRGVYGAVQADWRVETPFAIPAWGFEPPGVPLRRRPPGLQEQPIFVAPTLAGYSWHDGLQAAPMARPRPRRTVPAAFNIDATFVFVAPPTFVYSSSPDVLLARTFWHPAGAILPFDDEWYLRTIVPVFYATTVVSAARSRTVVKGEQQGR